MGTSRVGKGLLAGRKVIGWRRALQFRRQDLRRASRSELCSDLESVIRLLARRSVEYPDAIIHLFPFRPSNAQVKHLRMLR